MRTMTIQRSEPVDVELLAAELAADGWPDCTVDWDGQRVTISGPLIPDDPWTLLAAHRTDRREQFEQLRAKARAVWRGDGTFTQAQAQKILAGLVLDRLRD